MNHIINKNTHRREPVMYNKCRNGRIRTCSKYQKKGLKIPKQQPLRHMYPTLPCGCEFIFDEKQEAVVITGMCNYHLSISLTPEMGKVQVAS